MSSLDDVLENTVGQDTSMEGARALSDNIDKFFALLDVAGAVTLDNGAMLTDWEIAEVSGDPENQVVRFAWTDGEHNYSTTFNEGGIQNSVFSSDGKFVCQDGEGNEVAVHFFEVRQLSDPSSGFVAAKRFMEELLDSVQTLGAIAEEYGTRTLADLLYLQQAILNGTYIDHYPEESGVLEIVRNMESGDQWAKFIKLEPSLLNEQRQLALRHGYSAPSVAEMSPPVKRPSVGGVNEIGRLHRSAPRFAAPLSDQDREQVTQILANQGGVVVGTTLLAVDADDHPDDPNPNPTGTLIIGVSDDVYYAAKTGCAAGIAEAIRWAESQPIDEEFLSYLQDLQPEGVFNALVAVGQDASMEEAKALYDKMETRDYQNFRAAETREAAYEVLQEVAVRAATSPICTTVSAAPSLRSTMDDPAP